MKYIPSRDDEFFIELIKKVFFLAMMDGYVNPNPKKSKIVELSGSRCITFEHDEDGYHFVVTDTYWVTKLSDFSSGITVISCDGEPVWSMTYGGMYPKDEIPFLKSALRETYSKNGFYGGRGDFAFFSKEKPPLRLYTNNPYGNFEYFHGDEMIIDCASGTKLGWHYYNGNLML